MIVYFESNFIIELVRLQDQHAGCEGVLNLAEENRIKLVLPAFSVEEPYGVWGRKRRARKEIVDTLKIEQRYLEQSGIKTNLAMKMKVISERLARLSDDERQRLNTTMGRILKAAVVIPLTADIFSAAAPYQLKPLRLSPPDSIIYAAVLSDLVHTPQSIPKCFLNKNRRDFFEPIIRKELRKHGCELIPNFNEGLKYINSHI